MNNYQFSCPLEGCMGKLTTSSPTDEEAINNLTQQAKDHLASAHPEISKTDEEVKSDISSMMERAEPAIN